MASCRPAHHLAAPSGSVPSAARSGAHRSAVCFQSAVQLAPTISQHCSAGPTLPPLAVTWLHRCRDMWCWTGPTPSSSGWKSTSIPSLVRAWPAGQRRLHARLGPRQHAVGRPCTGRPARTRELAPASAEPSACLKAAHTLDRRRTALPRPGLSRRELHLDGRGGRCHAVICAGPAAGQLQPCCCLPARRACTTGSQYRHCVLGLAATLRFNCAHVVQLRTLSFDIAPPCCPSLQPDHIFLRAPPLWATPERYAACTWTAMLSRSLQSSPCLLLCSAARGDAHALPARPSKQALPSRRRPSLPWTGPPPAGPPPSPSFTSSLSR